MQLTIKEIDLILSWFEYVVSCEVGIDDVEQDLANKLNDYVREKDQNI